MSVIQASQQVELVFNANSLRAEMSVAGVEPFLATATAQPKLQHHFPLNSDATPAFDRAKHWANLSPQYSVASFGLNTTSAVPSQCSLTQVHLVRDSTLLEMKAKGLIADQLHR